MACGLCAASGLSAVDWDEWANLVKWQDFFFDLPLLCDEGVDRQELQLHHYDCAREPHTKISGREEWGS